MNIQIGYSAPAEQTFAHHVGARECYGTTQPAYIALYLGGYDGVRVSLSYEQARALAVVLTQAVEQRDDNDGKHILLAEHMDAEQVSA